VVSLHSATEGYSGTVPIASLGNGIARKGASLPIAYFFAGFAYVPTKIGELVARVIGHINAFEVTAFPTKFGIPVLRDVSVGEAQPNCFCVCIRR
jgi:hypothetical protein